MDLKKTKNSSPRVKVIQKLYNSLMNPNSLIEYPKSQYKKFIKDVVTGTLERSELIKKKIKFYLLKEIIMEEQLVQLWLDMEIYLFKPGVE